MTYLFLSGISTSGRFIDFEGEILSYVTNFLSSF